MAVSIDPADFSTAAFPQIASLDIADLLADPASYYPPATDESSQSIKTQLRLPPIVMGEIHGIINGKTWPFRDVQHLLRFAVWLTLHIIQRASPGKTTLLRQVELVNYIMQQEEYRQEINITFLRMREQVMWFIEQDDYQELRRFLKQSKDRLEEIPLVGIDSWYGPWQLRRFETEFGGYLRGHEEEREGWQ